MQGERLQTWQGFGTPPDSRSPSGSSIYMMDSLCVEVALYHADQFTTYGILRREVGLGGGANPSTYLPIM